MEKLISVIVPVYNVEAYLRKCVDSICAQTYRNLEIILVDDGSPDNCGAICDEYARKDPRVKVIHKKNGGLSDARNAGLDICNGEYVAFVDSDDWIEPQMYQRLYELIEQFDAEMAIGGIVDEVVENGETRTVNITQYEKAPFAEDNLEMMRRYFQTAWAAWDKLYRAELFDGIRYPVGEINEDEAIVLQLLDRCRRVCYSNEVFYHYIRRTDGTSITTSSFSEKKLAWVKHCRDNLEFIREKYPELELDAAARYRSSLLWALREIALCENDLEKERKWVKKLLREEKTLFRAVPFDNIQGRLRYLTMQCLPFWINKLLLRSRHKK